MDVIKGTLLLSLVLLLVLTRVINSNKLMVILLDGFRWDYFNIHGRNLRGFPKLFDIGTKVKYTTVDFPTLSYPNYYTIMTGLYDDVHGMVGNYMYDEKHDTEFLIGTNPEYNQSYWWDGGDPIWITATRQKKSVNMYYWPNCEVEIRGLKPAFCTPYTGVPTRKDFVKAINDGVSKLASEEADFVGIYFELTDKYGHMFGPRSQELRKVINEADEDINRLLEDLDRRNLHDKVDLMIVSDHGMTAVSPERSVRVEDYVNVSEVQRFLSGGAQLYLWPKDGKLDLVYNSLKDANEHMRVYKREETPIHWHYRKSDRISPIVISMEIGWVILKPNETYKYYNDIQPLSGTHGYENEESNMRGIFVAAGPHFKSSFIAEPIHAVDMYQLMCRSLDIQPSPHNGSWDSVAAMWKSEAIRTSNMTPWCVVAANIFVLLTLHLHKDTT